MHFPYQSTCQLMDRDQKPNCCEVIGIILYGLFRAFIILCPIIAQIRVIYMMCKPEDYLQSPDKCTRVTTHIQLLLGLYIVGYALLYLTYNFVTFLIDNFSNHAEPVKMHVAQTIVGLVVFKLYYELFQLGVEGVYRSDDSCAKQFFGTILLAILTVGLFLIYRYFQVTIHNWNSPDDCKRQTVRFFGGFGIFYIYYRLWKFGLKCVYQQNASCVEQFFGTLILAVVSLLLYLPFRAVNLICKYWNNDNSCYRQTARFFGGLGIFYIYYRLWKYAAYATYDSDNGCENFGGHILFTLITVGLFIPFRIIQAICNNWNSGDDCKRETARFFGGLGVFYVYFHLWKQGIKLTYHEDSFCGQVGGHILLTLATVGLFIPFRILQAIIVNWDSQVKWKKQFARCVGLLVVFYLWYKMMSMGFEAVYRSDEAEAEHRDKVNSIFGHILLTLSTLGLYLIYKPFELIYLHWYDQNDCKRETARFFGGLGIFYIYYQMIFFGVKWVYKDNQNNCKFVTGHLLLLVASVGIYIPWRIVELIITKWNSDNFCYRETARIFGGLVIFYIWYHMFVTGFNWVYKDNNGPCYTFFGYIFMTLSTLGIFIPVQLAYKGTSHTYDSNNICLNIVGHIELTIVTLGLFLIFRFFQLICNNWSSDDPVKRHIVRAIVGLIVFYLWYLLIVESFEAVYRGQDKCKRWLGRLGLLVGTLGLYFPVMIVEYFIEMCTKLNQSYFLSQPHKTGVLLACPPTLGFFGLYTMTRMQDRWPRYIGNLIIVGINAVAVYYLVIQIVWPAPIDENYRIGIICALCVVSYPFMKFMAEFIIFNHSIRLALSAIRTGIHYSYLGVKFALSRVVGYPLYVTGVSIGNWFSRLGASFSTWGSRIYSRSANRRWIWAGYFFRIEYIAPEHPEYYAPRVHEPNISVIEPFLGWDEREQIRLNKPEYILDEKRQNHQYVMDCVAGNVEYNFNKVLKKHSTADIVLWWERYCKLLDTLRSKAFYQRMVNVSLDNPENFRQVDGVLEALKQRRKQIVYQPIEYFNSVERDGAFEISVQ